MWNEHWNLHLLETDKNKCVLHQIVVACLKIQETDLFSVVKYVWKLIMILWDFGRKKWCYLSTEQRRWNFHRLSMIPHYISSVECRIQHRKFQLLNIYTLCRHPKHSQEVKLSKHRVKWHAKCEVYTKYTVRSERSLEWCIMVTIHVEIRVSVGYIQNTQAGTTNGTSCALSLHELQHDVYRPQTFHFLSQLKINFNVHVSFIRLVL